MGIKNGEEVLRYLEGYQHSSFADFDGVVREEKSILTPEVFPEYFPQREVFRKEIFEWITFNPQAIELQP